MIGRLDEGDFVTAEGSLFGKGRGNKLLEHEVVAVDPVLDGGGAANGPMGDLEMLKALGQVVLVARAKFALADKLKAFLGDDG